MRLRSLVAHTTRCLVPSLSHSAYDLQLICIPNETDPSSLCCHCSVYLKCLRCIFTTAFSVELFNCCLKCELENVCGDGIGWCRWITVLLSAPVNHYFNFRKYFEGQPLVYLAPASSLRMQSQSQIAARSKRN